MAVIFKRTVGVKGPDINGTWTGVDITNYTITLEVDQDGTLLTKTAAITDGPAGEFRFTFSSSDWAVGEHQAQLKWDDGAGNDGCFFETTDCERWVFLVRELG